MKNQYVNTQAELPTSYAQRLVDMLKQQEQNQAVSTGYAALPSMASTDYDAMAKKGAEIGKIAGDYMNYQKEQKALAKANAYGGSANPLGYGPVIG